MPRRIVRYAIIALFTAIGLTFMGLADQIVMMAFGLILGSAAVATAIAFGLGGRDAAGRVADRWADRITGALRHSGAPRPRGAQATRGRQPAAVGVTPASRPTSRSTGRARRAGGTRASPSPRRAAMPRRASFGPATSGRARKCSAGC